MSFRKKTKSAAGKRASFLTAYLRATECDHPIPRKWYVAFESRCVSPFRKLGFIQPSHMTYFRLAVCLVLLVFHPSLSYMQILVLAVLGGLSDFFDGALARSTSRISKLGILLDPVADKLLVLTLIFILVLRGDLHPTYIPLMALMELYVVVIPALSGFYGILRGRSDDTHLGLKNRVDDTSSVRTKPMPIGRAKLLLYGLGIFFMIIGKTLSSSFLFKAGNYLLITGICIGAVGFVLYILRWSKQPHMVRESMGHSGRHKEGLK